MEQPTTKEYLAAMEVVMQRHSKTISEEEVEKWRDTLTECSYDKLQHRKENLVPSADVVGTTSERFIVTKREINLGIAMVRQFATIAGVPHSYKVAPTLAPAFEKSKALYALILSLEYAMQALVRFSEPKLVKFEEELQDVADKLDKLQRYSDIVRQKLHDLRNRAGDPDLPDLYNPAPPKEPPVVRKPVRHINFGERKEPERKASKFNLGSLIKKKNEHT